MKRIAREYIVAVQSFSRIPVARSLVDWAGHGAAQQRASVAHWPGVGLLIGMAACVAFAVVSLLLPDAPTSAVAAAIGCTIVTAWLTGARHELGLADIAGRAAALALLLALGMKVSLLAAIATHSPAAVLSVLIAAHAVSRFWALVAVRQLPHATDAERYGEQPVIEELEPRALVGAGLWCVLPLAVMVLAGRVAFTLLAVIASAAAYRFVRGWLQRRQQGFTADGLSAVQQVCEIAFYLGAAIGTGAGSGR